MNVLPEWEIHDRDLGLYGSSINFSNIIPEIFFFSFKTLYFVICYIRCYICIAEKKMLKIKNSWHLTHDKIFLVENFFRGLTERVLFIISGKIDKSWFCFQLFKHIHPCTCLYNICWFALSSGGWTWKQSFWRLVIATREELELKSGPFALVGLELVMMHIRYIVC